MIKKNLLFFIFITFFVPLSSFGYDASGEKIEAEKTGHVNQGEYFYSFWKSCGDAHMILNDKGKYSAQWDSSRCNWVGGKGWRGHFIIDNIETIQYEAKFDIKKDNGVYFGVYGWTTYPLIEYYILDSYGSYNPLNCSGGESHGEYTSNGAIYKVVKCKRVNKPSIEGTKNFDQYFSVRTPKKEMKEISGKVDLKDHFEYWRSKGLYLGKQHYLILATESWDGTGTSEVEIKKVIFKKR
jgi:hypothetical protein